MKALKSSLAVIGLLIIAISGPWQVLGILGASPAAGIDLRLPIRSVKSPVAGESLIGGSDTMILAADWSHAMAESKRSGLPILVFEDDRSQEADRLLKKIESIGFQHAAMHTVFLQRSWNEAPPSGSTCLRLLNPQGIEVACCTADSGLAEISVLLRQFYVIS
jgi:hypothetical protein